MPSLSQKLLAVVAAMVVGGLIVFLTETLAGQVAPPPADMDFGDPAQLKAALEAGQVPFTNLLLVASGWLLGAYTGGTVAWRVARHALPVWGFAVLFTLAVLSILMQYYHPTWMWIAGLGAAPLFALGGAGQTISVRAPGR